MERTIKYRLPTEAEWEYACRASTPTVFSFGDEIDRIGEYAWYSDNSQNRTHPGGKKKPNAWGLYDMHGNVWEWCQDWYGDYPSNSVADPKGPDKGKYRVLRGGSWLNYAGDLRSANRLGSNQYSTGKQYCINLLLRLPGSLIFNNTGCFRNTCQLRSSEYRL